MRVIERLALCGWDAAFGWAVCHAGRWIRTALRWAVTRRVGGGTRAAAANMLVLRDSFYVCYSAG